LRLFDLIFFLSWKDLRTDDCLLCRGTNSRDRGYKQHTELGDNRSDEYCHCARNIHFYLRNWFHQRQPNGDDDLHADGNECRGLDLIDGKNHGNSGRRFLGDRNHFLPQRNTRGSLRRLHHRRQRRFSTLHLF